jgi:tRNA G18 (ribose-2'-O)-methylase SpoU
MDYDKLPEKYKEWTSPNNVRGEFKNLSIEQTKALVISRGIKLSITMAHVIGDFNFSSLIRSANGFGVTDVFYFGKKKFDKRGAVGTYHYINVVYLDSIEELRKLKSKYRFVALENNIIKNPISIIDYSWKEDSMILVGEEGNGLAEDVLELCDDFIEIPMLGSITSFNVAVAASIAMFDFSSKLKS